MRLKFLPLFIAAALLSGAEAQTKYETATFEVVTTDGDFEVRQYAAHVVVTTAMKSGQNDGSFGRLFQYISGSNEGGQKIEMTTPVFMPAADDGEPGEMQFVVPSAVAKAGAPAPADPSVKLGTMSAGKYAVIRYSGVADAEMRKAKLTELLDKMKAKGLEPIGNPIHAGYDPPWIPGPERRNEVLLRIK